MKYLTAMLIHETLNVDANGACTFVKNGKLWSVVEETCHLKHSGSGSTAFSCHGLQAKYQCRLWG